MLKSLLIVQCRVEDLALLQGLLCDLPFEPCQCAKCVLV